MAKFTLEELKDGKLGDVDRVTIMSLGSKDNRVYGNCTDGTATMKYTFFDTDWLKEGDIVNVKSAYYKTDYNSLQIKKGGSVVKAIQPASRATLNKEEMDALVEDYITEDKGIPIPTEDERLVSAVDKVVDKLLGGIKELIKAINELKTDIGALGIEMVAFKQVISKKEIEVVNKSQKSSEDKKQKDKDNEAVKQLESAVAKNEAKK